MARRVFFSFHYQRDVWRANQIRNIHNIIGTAAAGFQDASLWEEAYNKWETVGNSGLTVPKHTRCCVRLLSGRSISGIFFPTGAIFS